MFLFDPLKTNYSWGILPACLHVYNMLVIFSVANSFYIVAATDLNICILRQKRNTGYIKYATYLFYCLA